MAKTPEQNQQSAAERANTDEKMTVGNKETAGPLKTTRTTQDVRQGHTGDHVRYILGISFIGAAIALFAPLLGYAQMGERTTVALGEINEAEETGAAANEQMTETMRAAANLAGVDGELVGSVALEQTVSGVLITSTLKDFPPGAHAFHIHETGSCSPDFSAAGGHFAPEGADHGFNSENGPHAGDFPNIHVGQDGALKIEYLNSNISLDPSSSASLFDNDGSAIVVHRGTDDYRSEPAGAAGDRIACGVIERTIK